MNYKIVADSSSNVRELQNVDYKSVPLKIICEGKEYVDDSNLNVGKMIDDLKYSKSASTTSCPNSQEWLDAFEGGEDIFAFTITSSLSGSFNSATNAKNLYLSNNENANVCVVDSLSTGGEMQLLMEKVVECYENGYDFESTKNEIENYKKNTHLIFCLKSMNNLAKNGRVSSASAKVALVLGIRVVGKASDEGTLQPLHKCRGEGKALQTIYEVMLAEGFCGGKVRISHCNNEEGAKKLEEIIKSSFRNCDVEINECGALCSYYAEDGGLIVGYEG